MISVTQEAKAELLVQSALVHKVSNQSIKEDDFTQGTQGYYSEIPATKDTWQPSPFILD